MASEDDEDEMNKKVTLDDDNIKDGNNADDNDGNSLIEWLILKYMKKNHLELLAHQNDI